ncbi:MAG: alternative ribosome rescue aminoacyl-tRNA hydrolase ArfB [Mycobacteriales bacterium]|nr:MAG: aminoacyl-tRNA hydrolase [Pseudonocardiales bacterium]
MTGGLAAGPVTIPDDELAERFSRSSGPGGQHVNTSDTRVELLWHFASSRALTDAQRERLVARLGEGHRDGVIAVVASEFRSQWRNRQAARARLGVLVAESLRPAGAPRRPSRPSRAAREARLGAKRHRGAVKRDRQRPGPLE